LDSTNTAWIVLFGTFNGINEAYKMMRRFAPEIIYKPTTMGLLTRASLQPNDASDEERPHHHSTATTQTPQSTPVRNTLIKASSSDASEDGGSPSSPEDSKLTGSGGGLGDDQRKRKFSSSRSPLESKTDAKNDDSLFKAVQHRDWALASELISKDEGINFVAPSGTTVLHKAAERNAPEPFVKMLIEKGLDPNQTLYKKGFTSLHFAVQSNVKASLLEVLVGAGGNVNLADDQGLTPVHLAVTRNVTPKLLEILIEAGADLSLVDKNGHTPLSIALSSGASGELVKVLRREAVL